MKVLKFGGSSVANAENIKKVVAIAAQAAGDTPTVVVLSAVHGTTDALIAAGRMAEANDPAYKERLHELRSRHESLLNELNIKDQETSEFVGHVFDEIASTLDGVTRVRELSARTLDRIVANGELLSTRIVSAHLNTIGLKHTWTDSRELIRTDSNFGAAAVDFSTTDKTIVDWFSGREERLHILPGFIASDAGGNTTTLGRGGSDYTAAIIAAALNAECLEIWTDVSGMMTADPRLVRGVRHIPHITYREAMELSHFGAKVVYPPTIQPVMAKGISVVVKNTFAPEDAGTWIEAESANADAGGIIRGITSIDNVAIINLEGSGMIGIPGFSKRLFDALSRARINVILITQGSSEHSICVAIEERFGELARRVVDSEFESDIAAGKIEPLRAETGFSILALVGDRMKEHTGVSGRMFAALGQNGVNIHAIAQGSSERNISTVIRSSDVRKAVNTLHEEFFSDGLKQLNIYIAGVGNVGKRLIAQLEQQRDDIAASLRLNLRIAGLANSKSAVIDSDGIEPTDFAVRLSSAGLHSVEEFTEAILNENLRNSVFVDVTASPDVVNHYPALLRKSVSVVACNKVACSSSYEQYRSLKEIAREFNAKFLFETNVGAGLPVINTLNDLIRSGDQVLRIEAVLSGTLNYVFNNYDGTSSFSSIVRQAQDEGYTEPDPRLDLSGTDVARKILILARESGYPLEMNDIEAESFLPKSCTEGTVDDFYREMERHEEHFRGLLSDARAKDQILKYIAVFDNGKAKVGLQRIGRNHNFATLSGKDNAVQFYTNRYSEQPLVIKGAGAGADVTAAGVFADILRTAR
ncbi:MAG TPA: bifunctional aspartate kinase/homoserine dehydrogenase I [Pyrinomonadaceae bacterium]|nr:bifunctional aspartate kinase/homoserine dehydrogenase I [Pyrinomonadaceae bacterium]